MILSRNKGEEKTIHNELMKLGLNVKNVQVTFNPNNIFTWEPSEEDIKQKWFISGIFVKFPIKDEDGNLISEEKYTISITREDGKRVLNGVSIVNPRTRIQEITLHIPEGEAKLLHELNLTTGKNE